MPTIFSNPTKLRQGKTRPERADRERSMVFRLFIVILHLILFRGCLACLCKHCTQANLTKKKKNANSKLKVRCCRRFAQGAEKCVEVKILCVSTNILIAAAEEAGVGVPRGLYGYLFRQNSLIH